MGKTDQHLIIMRREGGDTASFLSPPSTESKSAFSIQTSFLLAAHKALFVRSLSCFPSPEWHGDQPSLSVKGLGRTRGRVVTSPVFCQALVLTFLCNSLAFPLQEGTLSACCHLPFLPQSQRNNKNILIKIQNHTKKRCGQLETQSRVWFVTRK